LGGAGVPPTEGDKKKREKCLRKGGRGGSTTATRWDSVATGTATRFGKIGRGKFCKKMSCPHPTMGLVERNRALRPGCPAFWTKGQKG